MPTTKTEYRLDAESRATTGTNASHAVRNEAKVPGVIYGHGAAPVAIAFDRKAFEDLLAAGARHHMITLSIDGKTETAMIRDVQTAHVGRQVRHVDLLRVSATETVTTSVRVVTIGTAAGVRDSGGVMDVVQHDVTISGPAADLPDHVEVDVTSLGVHGHITAADVVLPKGVTLVTSPETLLVSVEPSKTAETVAADVEAAAEAAPVAEDVPVVGDEAAAPAEGAP